MDERFPRNHSRIAPPNRRLALFSLSSSVEERAGVRSRPSFRFMGRDDLQILDVSWDHEPIIGARSAHKFFSLSLPKGEGRGEGSAPLRARTYGCFWPAFGFSFVAVDSGPKRMCRAP